MARQRTAVIVPSVLDRLISPRAGGEAGSVQPNSVRALRLAVQRDLDALLNTRREGDLIPDGFQASASSLLNYGLPDFSGYSLRTPADQNRLRRDIETAIRIFEPRLGNVAVSLAGWDNPNPVLRFRVTAVLRFAEADEPVSFDTLFQADRGRFSLADRSR